MPSWQGWRSSSSGCGPLWTLVSCGWTPTSPSELTVRRKFGDNEDGNAAAERFVQAGHEFIATMRNAQQVFANMAATFRAAGRTVAKADEAGRQMFRGKPE